MWAPSDEEKSPTELSRRSSLSRKTGAISTLDTIKEVKFEDGLEEEEDGEAEGEVLDEGPKRHLLNFKRASTYSEAESFASALSTPEGSVESLTYYSDADDTNAVLETAV